MNGVGFALKGRAVDKKQMSTLSLTAADSTHATSHHPQRQATNFDKEPRKDENSFADECIQFNFIVLIWQFMGYTRARNGFLTPSVSQPNNVFGSGKSVEHEEGVYLPWHFHPHHSLYRWMTPRRRRRKSECLKKEEEGGYSLNLCHHHGFRSSCEHSGMGQEVKFNPFDLIPVLIWFSKGTWCSLKLNSILAMSQQAIESTPAYTLTQFWTVTVVCFCRFKFTIIL